LTLATAWLWIASTTLMRATESRRKLPTSLSSLRSETRQHFWRNPFFENVQMLLEYSNIDP